LYFRVFDEPFAEEIRGYAVNYFRKILFNLGWEPQKSDKHTDALLRGFTISVLGKMNDEDVTEEALRRYKKFLKSPSSLSPDLVEPICSIAAWNGNSKTHSELTKLYKTAKTMEEKLRFLGALCGFKDKKLLLKSLDFSQTSQVRSQNMQLPIMKVAANPYGEKVLWPWLKKNWKKSIKKWGMEILSLTELLQALHLWLMIPWKKKLKHFSKRIPLLVLKEHNPKPSKESE
jgi:tricorn protease interacting factor F2/3